MGNRVRTKPGRQRLDFRMASSAVAPTTAIPEDYWWYVPYFAAEKFEKIVLCTIALDTTSVLESSVLAWPAAGYDLPILWCNLTQVPAVMNVASFDFMPIMDPVLWPDRAAPIEGLRALKRDALTRFGDTLVDKAVTLPSRALYALSPYNLVVDLSDAGLTPLSAVLDAYLRAYHDLWKQATLLDDPVERAHSIQRRSAMRALMKANDPGFPYMVNVFGEATTHGIFEAVF